MTIGHRPYELGTTVNPSNVVLTGLVKRIQGTLSDERGHVRRKLEKLVQPIRDGQFGSFNALWTRVQGDILSVHQIVDDTEGNSWESPLLVAVVRILLDHFSIRSRLGGYVTIPFLKLAVSCVLKFSRY